MIDQTYFLHAEEEIKRLRSRLAEVEKENSSLKEEIHFRDNTEEEADEELMNRIKLAEGEKTWGCGHTNHGSCSQCLGHVTNERNDLLKMKAELTSILVEARELFEKIDEYCGRKDVFQPSLAYSAAKILKNISNVLPTKEGSK